MIAASSLRISTMKPSSGSSARPHATREVGSEQPPSPLEGEGLAEPHPGGVLVEAEVILEDLDPTLDQRRVPGRRACTSKRSSSARAMIRW